MSHSDGRSGLLERYAIVRMEKRHLDEALIIEKESQPNPWSRQAFLHEIEGNPLSRPRVAVTITRPSEVAGYAITWLVLDQLHIQNLAVRRRDRHQGLAELLLVRAIEEAVEDSASTALLEVRRSNLAARNLYRSLGFEEFGHRRGYYTRPVEDALLYRKDLRS
ncbi:MAG TPA: ribosomal protein S18-alanine N-acetyltransferase [Vicinamibacteria bacterium]|nr:ribosomal protein S18-alanine N-acetyltransferase [Vicinamibacteria bacterium]